MFCFVFYIFTLFGDTFMTIARYLLKFGKVDKSKNKLFKLITTFESADKRQIKSEELLGRG